MTMAVPTEEDEDEAEQNNDQRMSKIMTRNFPFQETFLSSEGERKRERQQQEEEEQINK